MASGRHIVIMRDTISAKGLAQPRNRSLVIADVNIFGAWMSKRNR
jgi:hypothetical protein